MYHERIANILSTVASLGEQPLADSLAPGLIAITSADEKLSSPNVRRIRGVSLEDTIDTALAEIQVVLKSRDVVEGYRWSERTLEALAAFTERVVDSVTLAPPAEHSLRGLIADLRNTRQVQAMRIDTAHLQAAAVDALADVTDARDKALDAAGVVGSASLATHFEKYASAERSASNTFRILAICAIVGTVVSALIIGFPVQNDWAGLAFRLALIAGLGTLAAYFGRQASQHRRVYNWAKAISVQLQSFPAFVEPIAPEDRHEIYRTFARRVLGPPPEKDGGSPDDPTFPAQVLDVVASLAKRTP